MNVTAYRIKLKNGHYLSGSSIQSTKDKYKALMSFERMERYKTMIDGEYTIESTSLELKECEVGSLGFNPDDTYFLTTKKGAIIHETNKYVYTVKINDENNPIFSTVEKHKREHEGTRDFKTGKGFKHLTNS